MVKLHCETGLIARYMLAGRDRLIPTNQRGGRPKARHHLGDRSPDAGVVAKQLAGVQIALQSFGGNTSGNGAAH